MRINNKQLLFVIFFAGMFFFLGYQFIFKSSKQSITLNYQTSLTGRVRGYNRARGYKIYLFGRNDAFNFDNFRDSSVLKDDGLGYYLDYGDSLSKNPNSDTLIVSRNGQVTLWILKR